MIAEVMVHRCAHAIWEFQSQTANRESPPTQAGPVVGPLCDGYEVGVVLDRGDLLAAIEYKAISTPHPDRTRGLARFSRRNRGTVVYGGSGMQWGIRDRSVLSPPPYRTPMDRGRPWIRHDTTSRRESGRPGESGKNGYASVLPDSNFAITGA
ncbi:MAG: hypothetical protein ABFS86_17675 [Planctomycetota bacterium]